MMMIHGNVNALSLLCIWDWFSIKLPVPSNRQHSPEICEWSNFQVATISKLFPLKISIKWGTTNSLAGWAEIHFSVCVRENLIWMLPGKCNFEAHNAQVQTTIYFQTYSYNVLYNDAACWKDYTTLATGWTEVWSTGTGIILKAKPNYSEKNLSVTFPTTNPTLTDLGSNPALLNKWPATNLLSHGIKHVDTRFPASTAMSLKSALSWDFTQRGMVVPYRSCGAI